MDSAPSLAAIARAVDDLLGTAAFPDDPPTTFRASARPVRRMGFALAASADVADQVRDGAWDALFLHRPWGVEALDLPAGVGIVCSHAAFDARLTLGANPYLAAALGMTGVHPFGEHRGRPVGMMGDVAPADAATWHARLVAEFGGVERTAGAPGAAAPAVAHADWPALPSSRPRFPPQGMNPRADDDARVAENGVALPGGGPIIHRIAVVGAMTDALVREAAEKGAGLYVTGQIREPARRAVVETGIVAIAIGHDRSEEHGLAVLAALLAERFPGLHVDVPGTRAIRNPPSTGR